MFVNIADFGIAAVILSMRICCGCLGLTSTGMGKGIGIV